jgi:hypothetical protein
VAAKLPNHRFNQNFTAISPGFQVAAVQSVSYGRVAPYREPFEADHRQADRALGIGAK